MRGARSWWLFWPPEKTLSLQPIAIANGLVKSFEKRQRSPFSSTWTETVCCSSKSTISGSKLKALFAIWLHWVVRLDISHHTRRPASKCQRKSEPLKHVSTKNLTFFIQTLYSSATFLVLFVFEPLVQLGSFLVYCLCIFVALRVFLSSFVGDFHFSCLFNTFS